MNISNLGELKNLESHLAKKSAAQNKLKQMQQKEFFFDLETMAKLKLSTDRGDEDHMVVRVRINKSPIKAKDDDNKTKNKNLDQSVVDNPPMKECTGTQITENLFIGDCDMSHDPSFIK